MYSQLEDLLAAGKWREANRETKVIILEIAGERVNLDSVSYSTVPLAKMPVRVLLDIDSLWTKHSNNHFGFSPQKRIWDKFYTDRLNRISTYHRFMRAIGWYGCEHVPCDFYDRVSCGYLDYERSSSNYLEKENPSLFSLEAPQGHLPMFVDWDIDSIDEHFHNGALDGIACDMFYFFARIPQVEE